MTSKTTTRRKVLQVAVAVICCPAAAAQATENASSKSAAERLTVDQITDVSATAATGMFRFEPDLLKLSPGDELVFLNSRSDHTVHTVPELWPDGVAPVAIAHKPEAKVVFEREGFYGFRCRRHGQYGMVMLVVVGQPEDTAGLQETIRKMRAKSRERRAFLKLADRIEQA